MGIILPVSSSDLSKLSTSLRKLNLKESGEFVGSDLQKMASDLVLEFNDSVALKREITVDKIKTLLVNNEQWLALSDKDIEAFSIGEKLNIKNYALSFTSQAGDIITLRNLFKNKINVTSKIESKKGLKNLSEILKEADNILIDRGDLSKEVPLHEIPKKQKEIIARALKSKTPIYVATNLLESMVTRMEPTRAEVNDVYNTLIDGATGLVLAAETAIGKYPEKCIEMIIKISKTVKNVKQQSL